MGKKPTAAPATPSFQGGTYNFDGQTKATTRKVGNNIVSDINLTDNERKAYDAYQSALPSLAQKAVQSQDFSSYADTYKQNQLDNFNRSNKEAFGDLIYSLGSNGYGGSGVLENIKPFAEATSQQISNIEANAPMYANQLRNDDLAYNTSLLNNAYGGITGMYDTGNVFAQNASNLSTTGNNWAQQDYQNQLANRQIQEQIRQQDQANKNKWIKAGLMAGGTILGGPAGGAAAGKLSDSFL